jgi:hypothetical protein
VAAAAAAATPLAAAALKKLFLRIPIPHADGLTDAARGHPITHISLVIP